jgi:two-component system chemotaxis sensor kinase CheA
VRPFDRSLLQIFSDEQNEHIEQIRTLIEIAANASAGADPSVMDELFRRAHTLKGAARAVGLEPTELLMHRVEELLSRCRAQGPGFGEPAVRELNQALDSAEDVLAAAVADRALPDIAAVLATMDALPPAEARGSVTLPPSRDHEGAVIPPVESAPLVRVNASYLDDLIRASSELVVATTHAASQKSALQEYADHVHETNDEWLRLRRGCAGYVRRKDHDPDFQRVAECLNFIDRRLPALSRGAQTAAVAQRTKTRELQRRADELHQNAFRVRMTPAETVFAGFGPMVREVAHQEKKQVEFRAEGLESQADRGVLQMLKDSVMHLLRNAVSHGIESEGERVAAGKSPVGTVRLRIRSQGDRLTVAVEDDGRGISGKAVEEEAIRKGLRPAEGAFSDPAELERLILMPGFSTARVITKLSGRGMGLSVVQRAVNQLRGEILIRPGANAGTSVSISVPLSISTQHVLLMEAEGNTFGLPSAFVDRLCPTRRPDLRSIDGRECIVVDSDPVPLAKLSELLELPTRPVAGHAPASETGAGDPVLQVAVIVSGDERAAIIVDQFIDEREAVIKESGLPPSAAGLSAGAIPLDDGGVAVMLNVTELLVRFRERGQKPASSFLPPKPHENVHRILVVDDSVTTRSLEKSILEAYGYGVEVAVDGLQALEAIRRNSPDLVITDVMMPRLNGFQLLEQMKNTPGMKEIPVILVTSLESREEQERGLSLGADAYIVKRKFDQRELLTVVRQIL